MRYEITGSAYTIEATEDSIVSIRCPTPLDADGALELSAELASWAAGVSERRQEIYEERLEDLEEELRDLQAAVRELRRKSSA